MIYLAAQKNSLKLSESLSPTILYFDMFDDCELRGFPWQNMNSTIKAYRLFILQMSMQQLINLSSDFSFIRPQKVML